VGAGGNSEEALKRDLKNGAVVVPLANLGNTITMLRSGGIDAFATNKGVLFQLADQLPGARVLDGRWGEEVFAVAIPKGRTQGARFLQAFLDRAAADGLIRKAAERARLRGIAG
jgi:polar amino acid transport system substrate-binding protein